MCEFHFVSWPAFCYFLYLISKIGLELCPTDSLCYPHMRVGGFLVVSILFIFSVFGVQCDCLQARTSKIHYIYGILDFSNSGYLPRVSFYLPVVVTSVMKTHSVPLVVWCLVVFYALFQADIIFPNVCSIMNFQQDLNKHCG